MMVLIGDKRFASIESAHEFLHDGGSAYYTPPGWFFDSSLGVYRK